jgi:ABC-type nitrate/sulfonate/bicarbonate transport system substrate-binding protein
MTRSLLRRSRTTWLFSAVLVAVFVVAGTGTVGAHQVAGNARPQKAMTTIHVDLNWLPNVEFSGIWVAIKKGWFKQAGLNVPGLTAGLGAGVRAYDFSNTPEYENAQCLHQKNQLCIGVDDSSAIPIARQAGQKLTGLWAGSQKTPFGFMTCWVPPKPKLNKKCVSKNSIAVKNGKGTGKNITSPKQWKGLNIGYQQDELYVPELMLGSVGLSLSDVHPVQVQFTTSDLTTGATDAHLIFVNNEPITLGLQGVKTNVIPGYKYGMAAFYADVMFVNDSQMSKYQNQIKSFVSIVDRGWKYGMHHPNATATMIVHKFFSASSGGGPAATKQQEVEIGQFAKTLARDKAGKIDGRMTLPRWKTIIKDLKTYPGSLGGQPIITSNINPKDCFTDKFAPPGAK